MSARVLVVDDSPTIRKVVGAILESRGYVPLYAGDGQEALEVVEREDVALVLLDFVMPRMNGYQFCRALRAMTGKKELPVVLMSAKGDKIRGQFVQQTGALDAITKPFDARALVAVVEGALKRQAGRRSSTPPRDDDMVLDRPSQLTLSEDSGVRRIEFAKEFARAVMRLARHELLNVPEISEFTVETLDFAVQRAMTPEALGRLINLLRSIPGENVEALSGDLSLISVAEILQLFELQRTTGALSLLLKPTTEVLLYLTAGKLDLVTSRGLREEFRLGRYLVEEGAVGRSALEQVAAKKMPEMLLGQALIDARLITEQELARALMRQTSELVFELVRYRIGRFAFIVGATSKAAAAGAQRLDTAPLIMEGFRRVDEWRLIEDSFNFDEVLYPDALAVERLSGGVNLTGLERMVLEAVDGQRTIREIVDSLGGSSFDVCKVMYQLLNSKLVRRKAG